MLIALALLGLSQIYAISALDVGYYQNSNAGIVYTGTWSTGVSSSPSYGNSLAQSNDAAGKVTIYTLPTVGRVGIYYSTSSLSTSFAIDINGTTYTTISTYSASTTYNNYYEFTLPSAGTNKVEIRPLLGGYLVYQAWQLLAPSSSSSVVVTAVVYLPTHTPTFTPSPTPTPTPTPTNTPGPSPTPTPTATAKPNSSSVFYGEGGQDVVINREVRPADVAQIGLLVILVGLIMTQIIMRVLENRASSRNSINKPGGSS